MKSEATKDEKRPKDPDEPKTEMDKRIFQKKTEVMKILEKIPNAERDILEFNRIMTLWVGGDLPEDVNGKALLENLAWSIATQMERDPEYLKEYETLEKGVLWVINTEIEIAERYGNYLEQLDEVREEVKPYRVLKEAWEKAVPYEIYQNVVVFSSSIRWYELKICKLVLAYVKEKGLKPEDLPDSVDAYTENDLINLDGYTFQNEKAIYVKCEERYIEDRKRKGKTQETQEETLDVIPTIRGKMVYKDHTKLAYGLPLAPVLEDWTVDLGVKVDNKGTLVKSNFKLIHNGTIEPYDLLIQATVGSIIENNIKTAENDPKKTRIYPRMVYRILADLPDEPATKGNNGGRPRDRSSKDVSDKDVQEVIARIDKMIQTWGKIDYSEQKKAWTKIDQKNWKESEELSGYLINARRHAKKKTLLNPDGTPKLDENGKPIVKEYDVFYIPRDWPLMYEYGKIINQISTMERGTLDTSAKGVKGLLNPEGEPMKPIPNTRNNTILKNVLFQELRAMTLEQMENHGKYESRRKYETLLDLCYGKNNPESKKTGKPLINFKKNVGLILDFFKAKGMIKDWERYPKGKGRNVGFQGVKITLTNPKE